MELFARFRPLLVGLVVIAAGTWVAFQIWPDLIYRTTGLTGTPTPEVSAAMAQADAMAQTAASHAADALKNQSLAEKAAADARDAAQKAAQGVAGYAQVSRQTKSGKTKYIFAGQVDEKKQPNGLDIIDIDDITHYEGGWKDSKPDGYGVMTYDDGRVHGGKWVDGENIGDRVTASNGMTWQGEILGGKGSVVGVILCAPDEPCRDKQGTFEIETGMVLNLTGPGIVHLKDGRTLKGIWSHGKQDGYGAELDAAGRVIIQGRYHQGSL